MASASPTPTLGWQVNNAFDMKLNHRDSQQYRTMGISKYSCYMQILFSSITYDKHRLSGHLQIYSCMPVKFGKLDCNQHSQSFPFFLNTPGVHVHHPALEMSFPPEHAATIFVLSKCWSRRVIPIECASYQEPVHRRETTPVEASSTGVASSHCNSARCFFALTLSFIPSSIWGDLRHSAYLFL